MERHSSLQHDPKGFRSMNWTSEQLAERIAGNPSLKLKSQNPLSPRQGEAPAKRGTQQVDATPAKKNKYSSKKTYVDGQVFDSNKEAERWLQLKYCERTGEIRKLERQIRMPLEVDGIRICVYICDFRYQERTRGWATVYEDAKGMRTPVYILKKKLVRAILGIEIRET
jgi:hypothetical protein